MRIRWLVAGWALASAVRPLSQRTGCLFTASPASERSQAVFDWTWAFVLQPVTEGCRLIARVRGELSPSWLAVVVRPLLEPTHLVMERKMLLRLKQRAEQAATTVRRRPFSISHPKAGRTCKGSQNDLVNSQRRLGRLAIGPVPVGGMSLGLDAVPVPRSCRETLDATV